MIAELTISVKIAIGLGVAAGAAIGLFMAAKRRKAHAGKAYALVTYENLLSFAQTCKGQYPQAIKSRVACEKMDDGKYRITQLILDDRLTAIKSEGGDVVGRIFLCRKLDDKIANRCGNTFPADFDMTI